MHTVIDDHSRIAYAEIRDDEKSVTAIDVLRNAVAWFAQRGVTIERVLSDNGAAYKSYAWHDTCAELGITVKKTRPYRPQTNGKVERFHRTLTDAAASLRQWRATLHLILADAVDDGLRETNPAARRRGRGKRAGRSQSRGPEKSSRTLSGSFAG